MRIFNLHVEMVQAQRSTLAAEGHAILNLCSEAQIVTEQLMCLLLPHT